MRIAHLVFTAALAASAALATPAQAKNTGAQKDEDKSSASSSSCSAYQQAPDGSWEPLPCKETGERAQPQTQHKTGVRDTDQGER
ncbi:hypothetical protein UNPF46_19000 [Bradyrhizobium sp. UNPF46]|uniref:hypothetical protein n=1 Tax=Bradyrhizobium sp. UNPF46 TaxID=1141168 RepID=UPI00114E3863|nr:hypothetical protein [Bradyrhizobium sp. UNPF46]TQF37481.1 hypothetical protein UNPF46_19000 [Bradyrhizobium sp. UNPF46]